MENSIKNIKYIKKIKNSSNKEILPYKTIMLPNIIKKMDGETQTSSNILYDNNNNYIVSRNEFFKQNNTFINKKNNTNIPDNRNNNLLNNAIQIEKKNSCLSQSNRGIRNAKLSILDKNIIDLNLHSQNLNNNNKNKELENLKLFGSKKKYIKKIKIINEKSLLIRKINNFKLNLRDNYNYKYLNKRKYILLKINNRKVQSKINISISPFTQPTVSFNKSQSESLNKNNSNNRFKLENLFIKNNYTINQKCNFFNKSNIDKNNIFEEEKISKKKLKNNSLELNNNIIDKIMNNKYKKNDKIIKIPQNLDQMTFYQNGIFHSVNRKVIDEIISSKYRDKLFNIKNSISKLKKQNINNCFNESLKKKNNKNEFHIVNIPKKSNSVKSRYNEKKSPIDNCTPEKTKNIIYNTLLREKLYKEN